MKNQRFFKDHFLNSINDAVIVTDLDGKITYWNKAAENVYKWKSEEVLGKKIVNVIPSNTNRQQAQDIMESLVKGESWKGEFEVKDKDGNVFPIHVSDSPLIDENGNLTGIIGSSRIIKDQFEYWELAKKNEEKYRRLFENLTEEVHLWKIVKDKKGQIKTWELVDANPSALKSWKKTKTEVVGKKSEEIFNSDAVKQFLPIVKKIFETGKPEKWEEYFSPTNQILSMESIPFGDYFISTGKDITKQHEIEQKLKQSDRVFNLSLDMFCIAGFDGYFKYLNPAWKKTLGWSVEELLSKPWLNFVHPDDKESTENVKSVIVDGKEIYQFENRYICKDGSTKWLSWNAQPFPDENIMIGAVRDVTEIKKTETELLEAKENAEKSNANIKAIIEGTNESIWAFDRNYDILYINHTFQQEFLQSFGVLLKAGNNLVESLPETQQPVWKPRYDRVLNNEQFTIEDEVPTDEGLLYVQVNFNPILKNGEVIGGSCFGSNITSRKLTEIELQQAKEKAEESEKQLRLISDNFANGMIYQVAMLDENRRQFNYISKNVEQLYGCTVEEAKKDAGLIYGKIHPDDAEGLIKKEKEALKKMSTFETEARTIAPNGNIRWAYYISKPRKIDGVVCWDGIEIDITERKLMELELIKAKEKAEEADRLKSAFLANMSHEIRTPMNGILGFTNLLQEHDLTGKQQQQYIEIIKKSGDRMLSTVNDIIEISKIDAGQIQVSNARVNISNHLITMHDFFNLEAKKKGLELIINNKLPEDESSIITDKSKVSSILTNLIKNAIKFTEKGFIEIGCKKNVNLLECYVKDTGIGIPSARKDAIFNRFEQADIEDKQVHEGSGLGLAIVKSYIEMLGGNIWVESEVNKGSTFFFTISYNPAESKTKNKNSVQNNVSGKASNLNVLIVEDDETGVLYLSTILKDIAENIQTARNGLEAVEMCKGNSNFDLILMDIKLPKLDGFEATKRIREFNKTVKIIAQTAQALEGDREESIKAGCDDYISKPVNKERLIGMIDKTLR